MAGLRLPGPLNILNLDGQSGISQLQPGTPPGPIGASPGVVVQLLPDGDPKTDRSARQPAEPITYQELMSGLQLSVYDIDSGVPMDANAFNWLVPFRTRAGRWIMEPNPIDSSLRIVRDRFMDLLNNSLLANHISGMLRRTRSANAEHKAYITADGNVGGMKFGTSHFVGNVDIPSGVNPIAVIHTHPLSDALAPPSFRDDFRRDRLQLVAEYARGRLWIAAWPNRALLLGQIVVGVGNDRHAQFRPIARTDPRCDNVFIMSDYVPGSRRILPP
jgi:hypothetical protein